MSGTSANAAFLEQLEADAEVYFGGGRQNNIIDMALTIPAILTSLLAATLAASDTVKWIRVGVARAGNEIGFVFGHQRRGARPKAHRHR